MDGIVTVIHFMIYGVFWGGCIELRFAVINLFLCTKPGLIPSFFESLYAFYNRIILLLYTTELKPDVIHVNITNNSLNIQYDVLTTGIYGAAHIM